MAKAPEFHGIMAEFTTPGRLLEAVERARAEGYRRMDAYTPYPIEDVSHALGHHKSRLPMVVLGGGIIGALGGFGLQYWASTIAYPMNVGGRPFNSWVAFIPPTFETMVLCASAFAVLGMFALNGLPQPYHPVFNVPEFARASRDRYFLCIEASDPKFDRAGTRGFLEGLGAEGVFDVDG